MTTTMNANGVRKNLAFQLDRLDQILDGLADGLNEAVVPAVQTAVGLAVQTAVRGVVSEVLANPTVVQKLSGSAQTSAETTTLTARLRERVVRLGASLHARLRALHEPGAAVCRQVRSAAIAARERLKGVRRWRGALLAGLALGVVAGVTAYGAGSWLAGGVSGLGGFAAVRAIPLRRALRGVRAALLAFTGTRAARRGAGGPGRRSGRAPVGTAPARPAGRGAGIAAP